MCIGNDARIRSSWLKKSLVVDIEKWFTFQNKKYLSHMVIQKKKVSKWKDIEVQDIDMRIWMNTDMARE